MTQAMRYNRTGLHCFDPLALQGVILLLPPEDNERTGDSEVVSVTGPLTYSPGLFDTYRGVRSRIQQAIAGPAAKVVLRFDDAPGGDAIGCFDAARALRADLTASGKPSVAYVAGRCSSGAYALASACDEIVISDSAVAGSIGVISTIEDSSQAAQNAGLRVFAASSGQRKTDGVEGMPVTTKALEAAQHLVDQMAEVFFEMVATQRPQLTVDGLRALDGGVFIGREAVALGLADRCDSFDSVVSQAVTTAEGATVVSIDEVRDALAALAKGSDAAAADVATRMLAAMDPTDEPAAADETPPPTDDEESDEDEAEPKPEKGKVAASSSMRAQTFVEMAHRMSAMEAQIKSLSTVADSQARTKLLASPGVTPSIREVLKNKPVAEVQEYVDALTAKPGLGTVKTVQSQAAKGTTLSAADAKLVAKINAKMGLGNNKPKSVRVIDGITFLGVTEDYVPSHLDQE